MVHESVDFLKKNDLVLEIINAARDSDNKSAEMMAFLEYSANIAPLRCTFSLRVSDPEL